MSSPPAATTSVEALDGATLAKVYAHLDPRDIVRVSAANKHLASAADEPLFRELFAKAWDEPAWPVASFRDLFLARHRATVAASAVDPAPMMASVESLAALKRGDAKGASTAHLADDARWGVVAAHAEELARAVNASETIDRTERTIDAANVVLGLHRWLIELTTMAHARRRCLADEAWWPASGNAALLAVSRALSACLTRCPRVSSSALLADETQTRRRPEMFSAVPEHPPLRELLGLCVAGPPGAPPALGCGGLAGASPFAAGDAAAAADEAYGGVDHDHGAVDDATLAAALGGTPVGTRVWPPAKSLPPRIDHCLALALAPLCLLRISADGDSGLSALDSTRSKAYPFLVPLGAFDAVPVPASVPSRGPWPRGGRPPHGQRVRLEKSGEPSTSAAMSGAWFGARLGFEDAGSAFFGNASRLSLDAAFRVGLTSLPDGTLSGWIRDTVGELTLRGTCDPRGDGAVTIEAKFTECGGLPAAALASWRHGRPRMRLRGWTSSASIAPIVPASSPSWMSSSASTASEVLTPPATRSSSGSASSFNPGGGRGEAHFSFGGHNTRDAGVVVRHIFLSAAKTHMTRGSW